jgi:hypothetical protein
LTGTICSVGCVDSTVQTNALSELGAPPIFTTINDVGLDSTATI